MFFARTRLPTNPNQRRRPSKALCATTFPNNLAVNNTLSISLNNCSMVLSDVQRRWIAYLVAAWTLEGRRVSGWLLKSVRPVMPSTIPDNFLRRIRTRQPGAIPTGFRSDRLDGDRLTCVSPATSHAHSFQRVAQFHAPVVGIMHRATMTHVSTSKYFRRRSSRTTHFSTGMASIERDPCARHQPLVTATTSASTCCRPSRTCSSAARQPCIPAD